MPISKKTLQSLATKYKLDLAKLEAAQAATEEMDVELPDIHVFTADELTTRDQNNQTIGANAKKDEFMTAGKEIAVKDIKAKFGITDASKDLTLVLSKVEAKINADDAAQGQIAALQADKVKLEKEKNKLESQLQTVETIKARLGKLPKNLNLDVLTMEEHLELIGKNVVKTSEGFAIDGVVVRNPTSQAPLSEDEAIKHFYEQKRPALLKTEGSGGTGGSGGGAGGRGGKDDGGGTAGTYKTLGQFRTSWESRNPSKNSLGEDFNRDLRAYIKEHPDLEMVED